MDYRKKLMEYKKLIGATTTSTNMRTVAYRDLNTNKSNEQISVLQLKPQSQKNSRPLSVEEDNYIGENRQSATRQLGNSIESSITRTVSFRDSDLNLEKSDTKNNILQSNVQPQHHQQRHKLLNFEEEKFINEDRPSATEESNGLRISSSSPSPQPRSHQSVLPTPGYLKESSCLLEPVGRYVNWNSHHAFLASQPWCCIGDLIALCDKYEFKAIRVSDAQICANIVSEVRALLSGKAPFDMRRRFPGSIRNMENLLVCIGRCPSIEYHLERILTAFRRPLNKLSTEKQNIAKQNFHLAVRELHLDISARISEIKLYDRNVFEKEFHLKWQDDLV